MVCITTLMDNRHSENKALAAEHGLSLWVETSSFGPFLFDCGGGANTLKNARRLGVDLSASHFTVLSHSHYDHAAGYRDLVETGLGGELLYTGPGFFEKKYARDGVKFTDLSAGFDQAFLLANGIAHEECGDMLPLFPGCWLVGNFERTHAMETIHPRFVRGTPAQWVPDEFRDEICLALDTQKGLVLVVGCSHPGILNMVKTVTLRTGRPVYAILGGTHLVEADETRILQTMRELKSFGVGLLGLNHCSGEQAEQIALADPSMETVYLAAGDEVCFPTAE